MLHRKCVDIQPTLIQPIAANVRLGLYWPRKQDREILRLFRAAVETKAYSEKFGEGGGGVWMPALFIKIKKIKK